MNNKELLKRVEELERRVRDLEARPVYVPVLIPSPAPIQPYPGNPAPWVSPFTYGPPTT